MKKKLSLLLAFVLCLGLMPCAYADNNPFFTEKKLKLS